MHWNRCIQRMCSTVLCCHSIVFRSAVSADRSGMAASSFLLAAAACRILLRFAAESRKSHCNGSVRRVSGAVGEQMFSVLALMIFLLKFLLKSASKWSFFPLWRRDPVLELQIAPIC